MKYYFIDDDNGKFMSDDGKRCFSRLAGGEILPFFDSPRGKGVRFVEQINEETGDLYFVEVPRQYLQEFRKEERHKQYLRNSQIESGYITISYDTTTGIAGEDEGEEIVGTEFVDVEEECLHKMELEIMREALRQLTEDELKLVTLLYLRSEPLKEREVSEYLGISQPSVNIRKNKILKKLEKIINQNPK